jgi:hypothetical protein
MSAEGGDQPVLMTEILQTLKALQAQQTHLASDVDTMSGRLSMLAGIKGLHDVAAANTDTPNTGGRVDGGGLTAQSAASNGYTPESPLTSPINGMVSGQAKSEVASHQRKPSITSRIILTYVELHGASGGRTRVTPTERFDADISSTYPGQMGINPLPMDWGNEDPQRRGPVVVGRSASTLRRRNGMVHQQCPLASANVTCSSYWRHVVWHSPRNVC